MEDDDTLHTITLTTPELERLLGLIGVTQAEIGLDELDLAIAQRISDALQVPGAKR